MKRRRGWVRKLKGRLAATAAERMMTEDYLQPNRIISRPLATEIEVSATTVLAIVNGKW